MTLILMYLVVLILVAVVLVRDRRSGVRPGRATAAAAGRHHRDGAAGRRGHRGRRRGGEVHPGAAGVQDHEVDWVLDRLGAELDELRAELADLRAAPLFRVTGPWLGRRRQDPLPVGGRRVPALPRLSRRPLRGRTALFERLTLEAFQSGLSWLTILRKRENFRQAFAGFDIDAVARFTEQDVTRLLQDAGIVRNRAKIEAAVANARAAADLDVDLSDLLWSFAPALRARPAAMGDLPAQTPESKAMATSNSSGVASDSSAPPPRTR